MRRIAALFPAVTFAAVSQAPVLDDQSAWQAGGGWFQHIEAARQATAVLSDERDARELDGAQHLSYLLVDRVLYLHRFTPVEIVLVTAKMPGRLTTSLEAGQSVIDVFPGEFVFQPDVTCGRKLVGPVQARGGHVDAVGVFVVPIGERCAAALAEGSAHLVR